MRLILLLMFVISYFHTFTASKSFQITLRIQTDILYLPLIVFSYHTNSRKLLHILFLIIKKIIDFDKFYLEYELISH